MVELLNDYTFIVVALGATLLGMISGVVGCFTVIQKKSLLGDCISHAALPGVVLAFIITGSKDTEVLLIGAIIAGILATILIVKVERKTVIKFDGALAMILSVFFGLGIVLLTVVQKGSNANQSGLDRFIYGQASSMLVKDVYFIFIVGIVLISFILLFYKEFKVLSFDYGFSNVIGLNTKRLNSLLMIFIVITIVIGLQTVGVILMSTMLISPAVAARQWVIKLHTMILLSTVFGAIAGFVGTLLSSMIQGMPTGPMIVVVSSSIVLFSILFAPKRGMVAKMILRYKNKQLFERMM